MATANSDQNLLFGIVALQMDFITRAALIGGMHAWVLEKEKPLGQILLEQKALSPETHDLLAALVQKHLALHGHDTEKSLASVSSVESVKKDLQKISDKDVQASLVHLAGNETKDDDPLATLSQSAGTPTSGGMRFRILRPHARGALGQVYVAYDEELHREVALKEIQDCHADNPRSQRRFLLEAEITGGLEHPGIVPVYGLGQHADGRPYYAMRFIKGYSLKDAIDHFHQAETAGRDRGERTLELRKLLGRFIDVCEAIQYAHDRGVLHRDLKPGNIMLGKYGETLVVDWGLAKPLGKRDEPGPKANAADEPLLQPKSAASSETLTGSAVGTPAYMSPEQAAGLLDQLGPASDVYSLGATLYCVLTGQPPLEGKDIGEVLQKVQAGEFPRPRQIKPQIDPALEAICRKATALKAIDRYASPRALADDLEGWMADRSVSAWPEPWTVKARRWISHHRALVAGAVFALLLIGVLSLSASTLLLAEANDQLATQSKKVREVNQSLSYKNEELAIASNKLEQLSYLHQVNLAYRAWRDNNIGHAERMLDGCEPRLRRWEWGFVSRLCHMDLLTLTGHQDRVTCVAFGPHGYVASAADDKTVKLWDTSKRKVRSLPGHTNSILGVAFSPDGQRVASASWDGTVKIWNTSDGKEIRTLQGHIGRIWSATFSPDGKQIASTADDGMVKIWDANTGALIRTLKGHTAIARSAAFSPDGKLLASASYDNTVKIWDAATGQALSLLKGHTGWVLSVAFHNDGQRLATASVDETIRIWDIRKEQTIHVLKGHTGLVWRATFSPSGEKLASASRDGTAKIWNTATGEQIRTIKGHTLGVTSVAFSPEGNRLASTSWDGTVKIWDASVSQDDRTMLAHQSAVLGVALSPDGKHLASGSVDSTVRLWDLRTSREVRAIKGHAGAVVSVAFSPDGRRIASASSVNYIQRLPSWMQTKTDGVVRANTSMVRICDAATGEEKLTLKGHTSGVHCVVFSGDGQRLATGSDDGRVSVSDALTGEEIMSFDGHAKGVNCVAFSRDGKFLASGGGDSTNSELKVWDTHTGIESRNLLGHTAETYSVAFSPDGKQLVSASWDGKVKLWNLDSGHEVLTLHGHTGPIYSIAFSPDGERLATASGDRTVKIWDAVSGQEILTLRGHMDAVHSIVFSVDGQRLASAAWDKTVNVWAARPFD